MDNFLNNINEVSKDIQSSNIKFCVYINSTYMHNISMYTYIFWIYTYVVKICIEMINPNLRTVLYFPLVQERKESAGRGELSASFSH